MYSHLRHLSRSPRKKTDSISLRISEEKDISTSLSSSTTLYLDSLSSRRKRKTSPLSPTKSKPRLVDQTSPKSKKTLPRSKSKHKESHPSNPKSKSQRKDTSLKYNSKHTSNDNSPISAKRDKHEKRDKKDKLASYYKPPANKDPLQTLQTLPTVTSSSFPLPDSSRKRETSNTFIGRTGPNSPGKRMEIDSIPNPAPVNDKIKTNEEFPKKKEVQGVKEESRTTFERLTLLDDGKRWLTYTSTGKNKDIIHPNIELYPMYSRKKDFFLEQGCYDLSLQALLEISTDNNTPASISLMLAVLRQGKSPKLEPADVSQLSTKNSNNESSINLSTLFPLHDTIYHLQPGINQVNIRTFDSLFQHDRVSFCFYGSGTFKVRFFTLNLLIFQIGPYYPQSIPIPSEAGDRSRLRGRSRSI